MKIAFYGDSLTEGIPGISYFDIVERQLPTHQLFNYGKAGDTVLSLRRRIIQRNLAQPVDIAFVWIGVNDVFAKVAWHYPFLKTLLRQPWSRSAEEFRHNYQSILDLLCPKATRVITVSPFLIGENIHNRWNRELKALSDVIYSVSAGYENTQFINLRPAIEPELNRNNPVDYIPRAAAVMIWDALLLRHPEQVDKKASTRSLRLTLDGVHLNSRGAATVSKLFVDATNGMSL